MICWWKFNCAQQLVEGDQTRHYIWSPRKQLHNTMVILVVMMVVAGVMVLKVEMEVMVWRMVCIDCVERGYYLTVITSHWTEM